MGHGAGAWGRYINIMNSVLLYLLKYELNLKK